MPVEVIWRAKPLVSHLHAAEAMTHSMPLADKRLAQALAVPAAHLAAEIRAANVPPERFWSHLIPQAANTDNRRQLVQSVTIKTAGSSPRLESIVSNVSAAIAAVETSGQTALPNLADELALRERPLREQWEARGPGLLTQLAYLTDEALLVESCPVLLVHPARGGGGAAHLAYNSVRFEAVLANPHAELPETLRLAWLIAQLHLDLPIWSEAINPARLPHVARFAMLPAILAAGEIVELSRLSLESLRLAAQAWHLPSPADIDAPSLVHDWWQTYQTSRPPWRVALAALDQLFG